MSWVKSVISATDESESPERFYYWGALAALSAVARKSVWLDRYYYKLYPNIYVVFVAQSGLRKGSPVTLARSLVEEVQCTRIVMGRNSMPQVLKDLSKAYSTEQGKTIKEAHGFVVSGELAAFFVKDPDALTVFTDLYDTHAYEKVWINSLKGTGIDKLHSPCLTLLGATNEDHFSEAIPPNAVGGGFVARTFLIFEDKKRGVNPLLEAPKHLVSVKDLAEYLHEAAKIQGQFRFSSPAELLYDRWYRAFSKEDHSDPTGSMERIHDGVLKVGMLLSLADSFDLIIHRKHLEESLEECLKCMGGMKQIVMGQGKSSLAYATKLILQELIRRPDHRIDRQKLLQKFWGQFDAFDLDRIMETLDSAGAVKVQQVGKVRTYIMPQSIVDQYTKYKSEVN